MAIALDIQQQVYDLLSRASNISFVSAEQEVTGRVSLSPGQRVTAEVLATLPNNRSQVRVGAERFNLELPMTVRPGQTLEMTFVSEDPRATFAIARQSGLSPPVSLSDASRLLSLLVGNEQMVDPKLRSSLQSIGDMLRRASGDAGVLANLMDDALTYGGNLRDAVKATGKLPDGFMQQYPDGDEGASPQGGAASPGSPQARLAAFESNASQILQHIARTSRFLLTEAVNPPLAPLPLIPGEEVDAAVVGTLPGGRVFVQVAGTTLELALSRAVQAGDILRLTYIASQPRPLFALPRQQDTTPSALSDAGRWLSVLEHSEGGVSGQQMYVLDRLNTVLKSLPPDSPAYTAILDEAITYQTVMRGRSPAEPLVQGAILQQQSLQHGNGIVLSDDMAKLLQALVRGNRLALLEALNQQSLQAPFNPGQQIKGEVLAQLGGGRFMVQVAGQAMEFTLPKGIQKGDRLALFFVAEDPRPTFLMARFGKPGDSRVSETGRWLSGFLGAATEQLPPQAALGIIRTLLTEPPADSGHVSRTLQKGMRESGLFYESHLARWFGGDYSLEDILKEPQGRLSRLGNPDTTQNPHLPMLLQESTGRSGSLEKMEAAFKKAGTTLTHEGIADQRSLPMVKEQLSTLQNGHIVYNGELFPGQKMEWKVAEREARRNSEGERESSWETLLKLELPRLGTVTARLMIDGSRVKVDIQSGSEQTSDILKSGRTALTGQFEAAGLTLAEMGVRHDPTQ